MSDINPLNSAAYYAGVQGASFSVQKDQKKQKVNTTSTSKFGDLLKSNEASSKFEAAGLPPEIQTMSVEEAAVYLKDFVDIAGDKVKQNPTMENIQEFKQSVQKFINFVVMNNYNVNVKRRPGTSAPMQFFSRYNSTRRQKDPRVNIDLINQELDNLTRSMLYNQRDNLKVLAQIDQIKGLIVDLMQA